MRLFTKEELPVYKHLTDQLVRNGGRNGEILYHRKRVY
jgi:hypothetical protein